MVLENFLIFVFGMTIAGITIIALAYQSKKQSNATSANILLKTLDRVREEDFGETTRKILNDKSKECDDKEIRKLLNYFEYLALFEEDSTLSIDHIHHMHGAVLKKINADEHIQKIIEEASKPNPEYIYVKLKRLLRII